MKKAFLLTTAFTVIFGSVACSGGKASQDVFSLQSVKEGEVLVTVNGTEIREGFIKTVEKINPRIKGQLDNPLRRRQFLEQIVDQQLLYQAAIKKGLDSDPMVATRSAFFNQQFVAAALLEKELDDAMKAEYEKRKDEQFSKKQISQIAFYAVPEEDFRKGTKPTAEQKKQALDRAKAAKAKLDKGEDFTKLAKEISDDKRTAPRGGDAGQVSRDDKRLARLGLQDLANKAFELKKDQISDPIEAPEGYYIIKATSDPIVTDFEDAKRVLGFELQQKIRGDLVAGLKKSAKIEWSKKEAVKADAHGAPDHPGTSTVPPAGHPDMQKAKTEQPKDH